MQITSSSRERADVVLPELDLRDLPAPEPMQRALQAADALRPGESVVVLTPLIPAPLLDALASRSLQTTVSELRGGSARMLIRHPLIEERGAGRFNGVDR
ncbi:MAG: DUF2249 domain-containing protein [Dokdonella sp.]